MTQVTAWDQAMKVAEFATANGWEMSLEETGSRRTWVELILTKGDAKVELNWICRKANGMSGKLADTRRITTPRRNTTSFSLAYAKRFLAAN